MALQSRLCLKDIQRIFVLILIQNMKTSIKKLLIITTALILCFVLYTLVNNKLNETDFSGDGNHLDENGICLDPQMLNGEEICPVQ